MTLSKSRQTLQCERESGKAGEGLCNAFDGLAEEVRADGLATDLMLLAAGVGVEVILPLRSTAAEVAFKSVLGLMGVRAWDEWAWQSRGRACRRSWPHRREDVRRN